MDIRPEAGPDQVARRRLDERAARRQAPVGGQTGAPGGSDAVDMRRSQSVERLVAALRSREAVDVHRVEDLRARIAEGSYRASAEELVDGLLALLERSDVPAGE